MSNNLDLSQVAANQNQKEVTINDQAGELDAAVTEEHSADFTSGNVTLSDSEFRRAFSFVAANLSVARSLTVPAIKRFFFVDNSAGTDVLSVVRGSTSLDIAAGGNGLFRTDGTTNGLVQAAGGSGGGGSSSASADWKDSVRVATTAAGTLTTDFENADTVDGVTLATGDRILIKDQSTSSENGIYVVAASGAPTRAEDFDEDAEVTAGCVVAVEEGDINADLAFMLTTNDDITVGSTNLTFQKFPVGESVQVASFAGGITASQTVLAHVVGEAFTIPSGMTGTRGYAFTAPSGGAAAFDVQKNGVSVGTISFADSSNTPSLTMASATSFGAGDRLTVDAPGTLNSVDDVALTIIGYKD